MNDNEINNGYLKGFTLIELMIAIAIVAILATVGMVIYSTAQKGGRISKRVQDLNAIKTALELYKSVNGAYPLQTAASTCFSSVAGLLTPTYMPVLPKDPLEDSAGNNCYQYRSGGANNNAEYKLKTNLNIFNSGEMAATEFKQQPSLIDPMRDGTPDCNIDSASSDVRGWAIYSGITACSY